MYVCLPCRVVLVHPEDGLEHLRHLVRALVPHRRATLDPRDLVLRYGVVPVFLELNVFKGIDTLIIYKS